MVPRAGLNGCGKSRPATGFDPRTVQPLASRYTDPHAQRDADLQFENYQNRVYLNDAAVKRRMNLKIAFAKCMQMGSRRNKRKLPKRFRFRPGIYKQPIPPL